MNGPTESERDLTGPDSPHFAMPDEVVNQDEVRAWEEVSAGRFMPRRTRGSCVGRALG
ncbi:MAG: hypothetical protein KDB23_13655 [Planctomycetales bacterium]|nr:hypothetical protein [Planctomycetales bacterium]